MTVQLAAETTLPTTRLNWVKNLQVVRSHVRVLFVRRQTKCLDTKGSVLIASDLGDTKLTERTDRRAIVTKRDSHRHDQRKVPSML